MKRGESSPVLAASTLECDTRGIKVTSLAVIAETRLRRFIGSGVESREWRCPSQATNKLNGIILLLDFLAGALQVTTRPKICFSHQPRFHGVACRPCRAICEHECYISLQDSEDVQFCGLQAGLLRQTWSTTPIMPQTPQTGKVLWA